MRAIALPPVYLPPLDETYRRVWRALQEIPAGETANYGGIADSVGSPKAARASYRRLEEVALSSSKPTLSSSLRSA